MKKSTSTTSNALWACLFLLYATAMLLYPVIFSQEASFCIKQDNLHQAYPFLNRLAISLHKGYLPVWDANTFGGKNFAGEMQTGIFYPFNLLWCWLFGSEKGIDVYYLDLLIAFHFFICLIGMYLVGRVFKLSPAAAIVSTLVFTFTSAVAARAGGQTCIFFGLTLLPWSVYFLARYYMGRPHKKYLFLSGLFVGMQILSGHMQPFFHTMLIIGSIICFYEYLRRRGWKSFFISASLHFGIIILTAVIISLPQLYYASEYLSQCYRTVSFGYIRPGENVPWTVYAYKFIINPSNLANLLGQGYQIPDDDNTIYMGILPLLLLIIFLIRHRSIKMAKEHIDLTNWLILILVIGVFSVLGYLTFFSLILYKLPFVNGVRQLGRYIILISFSSSLLVGLAVNYISELKEKYVKKPSKIIFYVLLFLCLNVLYLIITQQNLIPWAVSIPWLLGFVFFVILMQVRATTYIPVLAIIFICVDLYLNPVSYTSAKTPFYASEFYKRNRIVDFLESTYGRYRVAFDMKDYSLVRRNIGDLYNIQTKMGYGATFNRSFFDFVFSNKVPEAAIDDLFNVRYVVADRRLDSNYIFMDSTQHMFLYERKNFYPRIYWMRQLGTPGKDIEIANRLSIKQLAYSNAYQTIEVNCSTQDTLIISENYYPGWECYDNKKRIPIHPAIIKDYPPLFRCVVLDKGSHIVEFKYNKVFYWF